ncbi:MAG: hypothetical protein NC177_09720 [Ruminococcus flavefaciens]|nr:hypothetical protein [Ruminococcus flavefaciens]
MNEIQIFKHEKFGEIRTLEIDGQIYFVGVDVARALEYARPSVAISKKVKAHHKRIVPVNRFQNGKGSPTQTTVIDESGLYSLALASKCKGAEPFQEWVTSEVLPTIRKTGGYGNTSLTPQQRDEIRIMMKEAVESALSERDKETVMKLIPFFETLNRNIIRAINDNMKLLAVYIKWLIKRF